MRSRGLIVVEHRGRRNVAVPAPLGILQEWMRSATAGDGGNQKHPVALLERAGFAAKEADVFFVEVDVEELADLALVVADVARELGIAGRKLIQCVGDRRCATVHSWGAFGEATEGRRDFDGYRHSRSPLQTLIYAFALAAVTPSCASR